MKKCILIIIVFLLVSAVFSQANKSAVIQNPLEDKQKITKLSYEDILKNPKWKLIYDTLDYYVDIEVNRLEIFYTWFEHNPRASWSAGDYRHYYCKTYKKNFNEFVKPLTDFAAYTLWKKGYCSYFGKRVENCVWFTEEGQIMLDAYADDNIKLVLSKDDKGVYVDKIISPNSNFSYYARYTFPIENIDSVIDGEFRNNNVVKITYKNFGYEYWIVAKNDRRPNKNKDERLVYTAGNPHGYTDEQLNNYIETYGKDVYMNMGQTYSKTEEKYVMITLGHEPKKFELLKYEINTK